MLQWMKQDNIIEDCKPEHLFNPVSLQLEVVNSDHALPKYIAVS